MHAVVTNSPFKLTSEVQNFLRNRIGFVLMFEIWHVFDSASQMHMVPLYGVWN